MSNAHGLVTGMSRRRAGFDTQREQEFFSFFSLFFFLLIKRLGREYFHKLITASKNKTKAKNRQNKKGAPLLGLAKSIYYTYLL